MDSLNSCQYSSNVSANANTHAGTTPSTTMTTMTTSTTKTTTETRRPYITFEATESVLLPCHPTTYTTYTTTPLSRRRSVESKETDPLDSTQRHKWTDNVAIDAYPLAFPYHNDTIFMPTVESGRTRFDSISTISSLQSSRRSSTVSPVSPSSACSISCSLSLHRPSIENDSLFPLAATTATATATTATANTATDNTATATANTTTTTTNTTNTTTKKRRHTASSFFTTVDRWFTFPHIKQRPHSLDLMAFPDTMQGHVHALTTNESYAPISFSYSRTPSSTPTYAMPLLPRMSPKGRQLCSKVFHRLLSHPSTG
ncbi:hypothetical protein BDF14DRAFT_1860827 [Spinellus fusiger]|nr:hypothetical protein BDF14DRAFT_1860827 [Spinellus fusiger]